MWINYFTSYLFFAIIYIDVAAAVNNHPGGVKRPLPDQLLGLCLWKIGKQLNEHGGISMPRAPNVVVDQVEKSRCRQWPNSAESWATAGSRGRNANREKESA